MIEKLSSEVFIEGPFVFLEGPRWHDNHLWFSDMLGKSVYQAIANGDVEAIAEVPKRPSGLGFLPDGTLLIASMQDRTLYRLEDGNLTRHADVSGVATGDINDMLVDEDGYAYVGNFGFDFWNTPERTVHADLALVSPDGMEVTVAARELHFPNGTVMTGDRRLVVAETHGHRISAFAINDDRTLGDRKVFAELPGAGPDGLGIDGDDGVWVAAADQERFIRVEDGGRITHEVDVGPHLAVACTVGGPAGDTLYCLTTQPSWQAVYEATSTARIETVKLA
jgi:sugar lactone lactonase YvrE